MNINIAKGDWKQFIGTLKSEWGKVTGNPECKLKGDFEKMVGHVQTKYGLTSEEAEKAVREAEL